MIPTPPDATPSDTVPCRHQPRIWDADPPAYGPERSLHDLNVAEAVHLCRTECSIYDACQRYARRNPDLRGVVAGIYRPWTKP